MTLVTSRRLSRAVAAAGRLRGAPPVALAAAVVAALCLLGALLAGWLAPQDPYDLAQLDLADARLPPAWLDGGSAAYLLGSDDQGRDVLSMLLHGARISLTVAVAAVLLSLAVGVPLGLISGYVGGAFDALLMRLCDVMSSFPAILVALLVDGVGRALFPAAPAPLALGVLVVAIGLTGWVPYARTVRGATLVERGKDYVLAARVVGTPARRILRRHVLPNVMGPVYVLSTIQLASAVLVEATLSFLGVGMPATAPSLGTLIRVGNDFLFSGEWWIAAFPAAMLVAIAVSVNLFGDWLRDALDPRLR